MRQSFFTRFSGIFPLVLGIYMFISGDLLAQVDFSANRQTACAPLVVSFTDLTPGNPVSHLWDFDNGAISTNSNPTAVFSNSGLYDIKLVVTFSDGTKDSLTKNAYIEAWANPQVAFDAGSYTFCEGEHVGFADLTQKGSTGLAKWTWNFGDGGSSIQRYPSYAFLTAGTFDVTLVVEDSNACKSILRKDNFITVLPPPDPGFSVSPATGCTTPHLASFFPTDTSGNHFWDFGNGQTSFSNQPSHLFNTLGSFDILHIINTAVGCTDTLLIPKGVYLGDPPLNLTASPLSICQGEVVSLQTDTLPGTYSWSVGGNAAYGIQHPFNQSGTQQVIVNFSGAGGCTSSDTATVLVYPKPVASFVADTVKSCQVPLEVEFQSTSTGAIAWEWKFGDGDSATGPNPKHTYQALGDYDVTLRVMSVDSCWDELVMPAFIQIRGPEVKFWAGSLRGCKPLSVPFFNLTTSNFPIVTWAWDFGDGTLDSTQSPTHVYTDSGSFDVTLTVTNNQGCSISTTQSEFIQVGAPPATAFRVSDTVVCVGQAIRFFNQTPINEACRWTFGDGRTSGVCEPVHSYQDTGFYDITLITIDRGCQDTLTKRRRVYVAAPVARFNMDTTFSCTLPFTVNFQDTSVQANSWFWDFGDGTTDSSRNTSHTFTQEGTYPVSLSVTNDLANCRHTIRQNVEIYSIQANLQTDTAYGCHPLAIQFTDSSTNSVKWFWSWSNGDTSHQVSPKQVFTQPGFYDVSLWVENKLGCRDSLFLKDQIEVRGPSLSFSASPPKGCSPLPVFFSDSSYSTSPLTAWNWTFGDSTTDSTQNSVHTYQQPGVYSPGLTVTDQEGCQATMVDSSSIEATQPKAYFDLPFALDCPNHPIHIQDSSSGKGLTYLWDFGDGNTDTTKVPSHSYASPGTYDITLTVTDTNGCDTTFTRLQAITIHPLSPYFEADTTFAQCPPLLVDFTGVADTSHTIIGWDWNFGDSATSFSQNPLHIYTYPGSYQVELVVETQTGCRDTFIRPNYIYLDGPVGNYTMSPISGCPPLEVHLKANSSNTDVITWDSDNGQLFFRDSLTYIYEQPGIYYPKLLLTDTLGCQVSVPILDSITVFTPPIANFHIPIPKQCQGQSFIFEDSTINITPIKDWLWEFGDGATSTDSMGSYLYPQFGTYDVTLTVTDSNGCRDSITLFNAVDVIQNEVPESPHIHQVSVLSGRSVSVSFASYPNLLNDFARYDLYRISATGAPTLVGSSDNLMDTVLFDIDATPETEISCYKLQVINYCEYAEDLLEIEAHCTMELTATPLDDAIQLDWSPYIGWNHVAAYRIYRAEGYDLADLSFVDRIPGGITTYLDTNVSCAVQGYRVEAIHLSEGSTSMSDTSQTPLTLSTATYGSDLLRASVENNQFVSIEWEKPPIRHLVNYRLERDAGAGFEVIERGTWDQPNLKYQDVGADVQAQSYRYRMIVQDSCGNESQAGQGATSIFLQHEYQSDRVMLTWTPYEGWADGVAAYHIQWLDEMQGQFVDLARVPGGVTTYEHVTNNGFDAPLTYCYRITAEEANGNALFSNSNERCQETQTRSFVANAFSPNGDGNNDELTIELLNLSQVQIRLYNRWGKVVWQTRQASSSWDGKIRGMDAPEGSYLMLIEGTDPSGNRIQRRNSITLIR